jgi:hypothetical protein
MQSTGHASTHAVSFVPIQGSAITYAIVFAFSGTPADDIENPSKTLDSNKTTERLVEEKTDVRRRDLVGGNVVTQLWIRRRIAGVPRQVFAGELAPDQLRVFGEKQYPSFETDSIG